MIALRPSNAPRWRWCPASVRMESARQTPPGEAAERGTAAHHFAAQWLTAGLKPPLGAAAPNGILLDEETLHNIGIYVRYVREQSHHIWRAEGPVIERLLPVGFIDSGMQGTPDVWLYYPELELARVVDYKNGYAPVVPKENPQLTCYQAAVWEYLNSLGLPVSTFDGVIVQPNAFDGDGPIKSWETSAEDLWAQIQDLKTAAADARTPEAKAESGPWCNNCKALAVCPVARQASARAIDFMGSSISADAPGDELGTYIKVLRRALEMANKRLPALESEALARIQKGEIVPGFRKGSGNGKRSWRVGAEVIKQVGSSAGVTVAIEKMLTPAQAEKEGLNKNLVASMTKWSPGAPKIIEGDESEIARKVFGKK